MPQIPLPPLPRLEPAPLTLTAIPGLRAAGVRAGIKASGNPDVALLAADAPVSCAGIFTQNLFAAAPVQVSRRHLAASAGRVRAVIVNSGNANACTGAQGEKDALEMCARTAAALGCRSEEVLVCSTGVIGVPLPMDKIRKGIDQAALSLASDAEAGRRFLSAIMTTDAFPKEAGSGAGAQVAGVCKGAGMIEPDMATMLAFLACDLDLAPAQLQSVLPAIAARSFNAVHVDTHTSTNDTLLLFATGRARAQAGWEAQVEAVARRLSWLIARDGEGATKVTTIEVTGAHSDEAAKAIARHLAASALVRTALYGNDPNWGRFTSQAGNARLHGAPAVKDAKALSCVLQGIEVFRGGEPTAFDRAAASKAMAAEDVKLELRLGDGAGRALLMTSDLGYRYVEVNAEYTT
jgi:glutamate N-acetyltransferase / amino-acid N-acetyltransferase